MRPLEINEKERTEKKKEYESRRIRLILVYYWATVFPWEKLFLEIPEISKMCT